MIEREKARKKEVEREKGKNIQRKITTPSRC